MWLTPQGTEMTEQDWTYPNGRFLAYVLGPLERGGAPLYIVLNAASETVSFTLPVFPDCSRWILLFRTAGDVADEPSLDAGMRIRAPACSVLVFSRTA
jgi:glycogen operon protein